MKKKRNWLINIFLFLLLLVGLALIFNNQIKYFLMQYNGERYAVAKMDRNEIDKNMEKEASFDFDAVEPASTEAVLQAQLSNKRLPVIGGILMRCCFTEQGHCLQIKSLAKVIMPWRVTEQIVQDCYLHLLKASKRAI